MKLFTKTKWRSIINVSICVALSIAFSDVIFTGQANAQSAEETTGVASDLLSCLTAGESTGGGSTVGGSDAVPSVGTVVLRWNGEVEQARLILTISGTEAAHAIKVNGQSVAVAPLFPDGQHCVEGEVFYLDLPPSSVVQGINTIEITNDALAGDSWSASSIRLEVLGQFTPEGAPAEDGMAEIAGINATISTVNFVNSYDNSTQQARVQVPSGYDGSTAQPLLIFVHPRSTDMFYGENQRINLAADSKGWFYASPQMHGAWPGTSQFPVPNPPGQYAYASVQSQYDVVGTVQYVVNRYNIDPNRIYIYGQSMGSQIGEVVVGKFPSLFAAAFFNKGPSDWTKWYQETQNLISSGYTQTFQRNWMKRECYIMVNGTPTEQTPAQNPFCYQQRSSVHYARNFQHVPIKLTHSQDDLLVPVNHSNDLVNAINSFGPDRTPGLFIDTVVGPTCNDQSSKDPTPYYHCYVDDPYAVVDYLSQFTRTARPLNLNIATTQAQFFYWLKIGSVGTNRWAYVTADADPAKQSISASIKADTPLVLSFNLGTTPMTEVIPHPGVGLTATTYMVKEQGRAGYIASYSNGSYLDVPLNSTGEFALTISALEVKVSANPSTRPANQPATSTITVMVRDKLQQPVPDQTQVQLTTSAGIFPNNSANYVGTTTNGQLSVKLSLAATDGAAQIVAQVGSATGAATVGLTAQPTPSTSTITLATNPPGLQVTLDGQTVTAPHSAVSAEGQQRALGVVSPQTVGGITYEWVSWSDGGAASHTITVPTNDTTYTAQFQQVVADDLIFADGFEAGNLSAWPQRAIDGGDLAALPAAAMLGSYGLHAQIDDNNNLALIDGRLNGEKRYRARFYFDPHSIVMAQNDNHEIFRGFVGTWPAVLDMKLRFYNGRYQVRVGILNDSTTMRYSAWFDLTDAPHALEVDWQAATAPDANDGSLSFWLDGVLRSQLTGIDNDTRQIDLVRLGAISGIDSGTRGSYYFDAFESRRANYIGPAADAAVMVSAASNPAELNAYTEEELTEEDVPLSTDEGTPSLFLPWMNR